MPVAFSVSGGAAMKIDRNSLNEAAREGLITPEQAEPLWQFLQQKTRNTPGFHLTHILYYLGGLISIGAMTLFMTLGWEMYGGWGIFFISIAYGILGLALAEYFRRRDLLIPAGIMGAFLVALTPLAIYGLQQALGFWVDTAHYQDYHRYIRWNWLLMELGTLASGAILFYRYRLPFMVMPVAATLWYLSMDLTPFVFHNLDLNWDLRKLVSIWFGLAMILFALWVDIRSGRVKDFAFWLYLFGVLAFWGGLSLIESHNELNKFLYCCINLGMILVGAILSRRVFAIFGGFGVAGYLGYLSYDVFKDSRLFPFALTFIGLAVVWVGIVWQKHEQGLTRKLREMLPEGIRRMVENME